MSTTPDEGRLSGEQLVAHLRQFLVVIDSFGEILQIESGFENFLGHDFDDIEGSNALDHVAPGQADEIAAHFVGGGQHLIRGEHDMFELELRRRDGGVAMMDCLATRFHDEHDGEPRWLLALTPHSVHAPEHALIDDYIAGATARQIAARFAELRSVRFSDGVWIETLVLDDRRDGVFTTIHSGDPSSVFTGLFERVVSADDSVWNRATPGLRVCGGTELLPDELASLADSEGVGSVTIGVTGSAGEPELGVIGFGSHPQAFDGYVGRMEVQSLGLLSSALVRELNERLLRRAAERDALTGLANRAAFDISLESAEYDAVLYVDIDNFKQVNDTYGHAVGDAVLIEVAHRMAASCRPSDVIARIGGDEFAVLLHDVDLDAAKEIGDRLVAHVAEPMPPGIGPVQTTVSAGLAHDTADLLHDADMAMLAGKRSGRNELVIAPD